LWLSILAFNDEFCEKIAFGATREKIGKRIVHRLSDNKFRWWNAWTNGSECTQAAIKELRPLTMAATMEAADAAGEK
jgi:hypothetical protein